MTTAPLQSALPSMTLEQYLVHTAQMALEGSAPEALRRYCVQIDAMRRHVLLRAEVDRPLSPDERERLAVAETEVDAALYDERLVETTIALVPLGRDLGPAIGQVVFVRADEPSGETPPAG